MGKFLHATGLVIGLSGFVVMFVGGSNLLGRKIPWLIENAGYITIAGIVMAFVIGGGLMTICEKIWPETKPADAF